VSDRIVYVHADHESDSVNIITPKAFDALLEQGWEIKSSETKKISGKRVVVHHLYKPSKERGVSVVQPSERDERTSLMEHQHRGGSDARGVMVAPSNNSFLGTSDFQGLPGIKVANNLVINHAYAMGTDAANTGQPESACPWPSGLGRTQWLNGYRAAGRTNQQPKSDVWGSLDDAREAGTNAARGAEEDEVSCPYPTGTPQYQAWLEAFKAAGGKVV
jgi:ribosome modulation factor